MADKQLREVKGCGNHTCYCTGDCEKDKPELWRAYSRHTTGGSAPINSVPSAKIDVDVSEALTGLKAIQREAREATKALRELEAAQEAYDWRKVACDNITAVLKGGDVE